MTIPRDGSVPLPWSNESSRQFVPSGVRPGGLVMRSPHSDHPYSFLRRAPPAIWALRAGPPIARAGTSPLRKAKNETNGPGVALRLSSDEEAQVRGRVHRTTGPPRASRSGSPTAPRTRNLAIAAVLSAGGHGLREGLRPPPPVHDDAEIWWLRGAARRGQSSGGPTSSIPCSRAAAASASACSGVGGPCGPWALGPLGRAAERVHEAFEVAASS